MTLFLGWGDPLHLLHETRSARAQRTTWHATLAGLQTSSLKGGFEGAAEAVEMDFTPLGAYMCLGLPLHHLASCHLHPDEVLGTGWSAHLTEQLIAVPDWGKRWAIIEDALARRMVDAPPTSAVVAEAWSRLRACHGRLSTKDLAAATGRGSRQLQVLFREQIGLPPQTVSRILRFQRALTLPFDACRSLADRAALCGYYDEAHMNHDFRDLAGLTPAQLCVLADHAASEGEGAIDGRLPIVFDR
ncbi:helix-turn-helix domain-containing protein [Streptomyces griseocarneus]|uniref:helix-turn-helix domain-containing protein n=1 Tax=Streptomyces griseocarneus TaxID=51201 RepID=UPI00167E0463|nr:helix-turn-helix domain-containing protein [Streptomyces griseocarneus]MBZ6478118.1 helix-turn-helix domain-containing protein [Streptomyces griseocarneus]